MRKKKFNNARVVSYKLESEEYKVLQAYWALNDVEGSDRVRELLQPEIEAARKALISFAAKAGA